MSSFKSSLMLSLIPVSDGIISTGTSFLPGLNMSGFSSNGFAFCSLIKSLISKFGISSILFILSFFLSSSLGISSIFISFISILSSLKVSFGSSSPIISSLFISVFISFKSSFSSIGLSSILGESSIFFFFLFFFFKIISKLNCINFNPSAIFFTSFL